MNKYKWPLILLFAIAVIFFLVRYILEERHNNFAHLTSRNIQSLGMALKQYYWSHDKFPGPTFEDVKVVISSSDFDQYFSGTLGQRTRKGHDSWGNPLQYKNINPTEIMIWSCGEDGKDNRSHLKNG
jgi:hypothetical protein